MPLCSWTIECPGATVEFLDFDTEGRYDFVLVGDSPEWLTGDLTTDGIGMFHSPVSYHSSSLAASTTISFHPDHDTGGRGFEAAWSCPGGDAIDQTYTIGEDGHSLIDASPSALAWQCFEPYAALRTETWRDAQLLSQRSLLDIAEPPFSEGRLYCDTSADIGTANMALHSTVDPLTDLVFDHNLEIDDDVWVRLAGDAGDAVTTRPPHDSQTDRYFSGQPGMHGLIFYVSDWGIEDGDPPQSYEGEGALPSPADGVTPVVMCGWGRPLPCYSSIVAHVVNCGSYYLWKLPKLPTCPAFYATEPSGLPHANDVASTSNWGSNGDGGGH